MVQTLLGFDQIKGAALSVLKYGADPTGTTDSGAAIATALAELNAQGGGELFFPFGEYLVSDTIDIRTYTGIVMRGEGMPLNIGIDADQPIAQSRIVSATGGHTLLDARSTEGIALINIGFHSISDAFNGTILRFGRDGADGDSRNTLIHSCGIGGGPANTFVNAAVGLDLEKAINVWVVNCKFRAIQLQAIQGKISGPSSYSNRVLIMACNFEKCGNNNDAVIKDPGFAWTILSNTFQENRTGGLYVLSNGNASQAFRFIGNDMYNDGAPVAGALATLNLSSMQGFEISGNRIVGSNICIRLREVGATSVEGGVIQGNLFALDGAAASDLIGIDFGASGAATPRDGIHIGPNFFEQTIPFNQNIRLGAPGQVAGVTLTSQPDTANAQFYAAQDTASVSSVGILDCLRSGTSVENMLIFQRNSTNVGAISASTTALRIGAGSIFLEFDNTLSEAGLTGALKVSDGVSFGSNTTAEFNAIGNAVNITANKRAGYTKYNSNTGLLTVAQGTGAGATWVDSAGTTFTPS